MAESIGAMYLRLGLNLSELETGFVTASQTVAANISRLNRESQLIRIRSQVEIEGLDEVADAERIAQIRTTALNQQLTIQRDRVRILSAELQNVTAAHGANSAATQRATIRLERERLALAQLESELQNLQRTQGETTRSFGGLSDIVENMPPQLKAMAAGIMAVGTATGAAGKSVTELLENFRELQQQSYELNMSVGKTRDLLRHLRLGGGDIGDFEGYIRGITDAFVKGEVDDPEFIALRKYGAEITDATGRLKDFKDLTEEVYQAWKKADAAGEGIEFLQLTGGESGIRDAIQFFKRYEEALADAKKISKAGIDETQLHELDRAMNLVAEQAGELKNALGDIFVPAAQSAAQSFFEILKTGTEILTENKDAIQSLGFIAKETFKTVGDEISSAFSLVGEKISTVNEMLKGKTGDSRIDKTLGDMSWRYGVPKSVFGVDKMISGQVDDAKKSYGLLDDVVKRGRQAQAEYNAEIARTPELWQKVVKTISGGDKNPLNQYAAQRIQSFRDELEELRIELDFEDEIEKAKAQLGLWFDREFTRKNFLSDDEKTAIRDLYGAKLEQIQREEKAALEETAARAQEHWRNAADIQFSMTHSAFEKELRDIELWKDAQRKKADTAEEIYGIIAETAAKEADAFEREVDRIKGKVQSLEDKIFAQEHSRYENDLRKLAQERYQLYQEGIYSPALIERYYQNALAELKSQAAKGGDYIKSPTSDGKQRGGNGIVVIGGDQIIDDGLIKGKQEEIGLLADENKIRAQLSAQLSAQMSAEGQQLAQATKAFANIQNQFAATPTQNAGYQVIEGDKVVYEPPTVQQAVQNLPPFTLEQMPEMQEAQRQIAESLNSFQQPTISFETILTPLKKIESILAAREHREPPSLNVSPNIHIELGGAYVFDESMKKRLVDDTTNEIVTAITEAVQQATNRFENYSYGA